MRAVGGGGRAVKTAGGHGDKEGWQAFSSATGEQGRGMGRRHPGRRLSTKSGRGRRGAETMVGQMHEGKVRVGDDHLPHLRPSLIYNLPWWSAV